MGIHKGCRLNQFNFLDGTSFNDANLASEGKFKYLKKKLLEIETFFQARITESPR